MSFSVAVSAKESVFYEHSFVHKIDFFHKLYALFVRKVVRRRLVVKDECMYNKHQTLAKCCNLIKYYPGFGTLIILELFTRQVCIFLKKVGYFFTCSLVSVCL